MGATLPYSRSTIQNALEFHKVNGYIRGWAPNDGGREVRYSVALPNGSVLVLRSLREAYVFVRALTSAYQAVTNVAPSHAAN